MGTMVGLYESALDALCTREVDGKTVGPKIIASTATVRRAEKQILSLFNRRVVDVFPPPGPNRRDSFFAETHTREETNPRLYVGYRRSGTKPEGGHVADIPGTSGGCSEGVRGRWRKKNPDNAADPYMTPAGILQQLARTGRQSPHRRG